MKICIVHNFYQQPGGEDTVFYSEKRLLEENGHQVVTYTRHNNEIQEYSTLEKLWLVPRTIHNGKTQREFQTFINAENPDVIHSHNTFPLISPAIYNVGNAANIPVIQTLHNYRYFCPSGIFYRDNKVCEDCAGKSFPWPAIKHRCYRNSSVQSMTVAAMLGAHHYLRTWERKIDRLIALTRFEQQKFIQAGFSEEKVIVKPNFTYREPLEIRTPDNYAVFVGRLSREKGVGTLIRAWQNIHGLNLKIIGDGDLKSELETLCAGENIPNVEFLGRKTPDEVQEIVSRAYCLVFPSEWYETFGLVAVEAYACGVPVVASRLGVMEEIVSENETGLLFQAGNSHDLAETVSQLHNQPEKRNIMGKNARKVYEEKYSATSNYRMLINIYQNAIAAKEEVTA